MTSFDFRIPIIPRTKKGIDMRGQWLSLRDVADEVGYSERWVLDQLLEGKLRAQVIVANERRSYRVQRSDLDAYLERHRTWTVDEEE